MATPTDTRVMRATSELRSAVLAAKGKAIDTPEFARMLAAGTELRAAQRAAAALKESAAHMKQVRRAMAAEVQMLRDAPGYKVHWHYDYDGNRIPTIMAMTQDEFDQRQDAHRELRVAFSGLQIARERKGAGLTKAEVRSAVADYRKPVRDAIDEILGGI